MNRCINCIHYKMVVIRCNGRYKGCQDGFCALHKKPINKDGCCEVWQQPKIEFDLQAETCITEPDSPGLFIIDLDKV